MSRALHARNKLANLVRHHPDDLAKIAEARADLNEAKIADFIEKTLADPPPLSDRQVNGLAELLRIVQMRPTENGWEFAYPEVDAATAAGEQ